MFDSATGRIGRFWEYLLSFGAHADESAERRGRRRVIVGTLWVSLPYIMFFALSGMFSIDAFLAGVVLVGIAAVNLVSLLLLRRYPGGYTAILQAPLAANNLGSLVITIMLGGLLASGLNMVWALVSVVGALIALGVAWAVFWFGAFLVSLVLSVALPNWIEPLYSTPDPQAGALANIIGVTIIVFAVMVYFVRQRDRFQRQSDELLHNILPDEIVVRLKEDSGMIAEHFDEVSVLFADVVDFTPMSAEMTPAELVGLLNDIFSVFDDFVADMGLEKIKTIGDEYMVAGGVPTPQPDHAQVIAELALRMRDYVAQHEVAGHSLRFRIGINSGPVVAGIIGHRKFIYDLWGDTVNTASRMESHGTPGSIQITPATHRLIQDDFMCERRGTINVKGKGDVETWYLLGRRVVRPATVD